MNEALHGSRRFAAIALAMGIAGIPVDDLHAQQQIDAKVPIAFNRFYDYEAMEARLAELAAAHPELCTLESIGVRSSS